MTIAVPTPSFQYQGSGLTQRGLHVGPFPITRSRNLGTNFWFDTDQPYTAVRLRPSELPVDEDDPCTTAFAVFYTQYRTDPKKDGLEWRMVFRLTSDQDSGVLGVEASLTTESNYPEIDMSIGRFPFNQPGIGRSKDAILPADYQARLTVRTWNRDATISIDGWLALECLYVREDRARDDGCAGARGDDWVPVGRAALYPASSPDAPPNRRGHEPPAVHRL